MTLQDDELEQLVLFKSIFDQVSDAIYIIDPQSSKILDVNQAGCNDLGMPRDEVLNHSVLSLQKDVMDFEHWVQIVPAIREAGTFVFVGRHVRKDGTDFPVEVHTNYFTHNNEGLLVSIARDISDRVQLEQELKSREPQLSYALNEASDGLWDWNVATDEVFFSRQLKRMLGYGPHEMKPHVDTWKSNIHPDDMPLVIAALQQHLEEKNRRYEAEYRLRNRNGQYIWVYDHGSVCERSADGEPLRVVGMVHNISKSKALEKKLRTQAAYDELTNLLNRRAGYDQFRKYLNMAHRHQQQLSIALLDLDHFKRINDNLGHLVGDEVLRSSADCLNAELREYDVLLRWGGEEFLLLMPDTQLADAYNLCDRLREKLAACSVKNEGLPDGVTISGGVACYPNHGSSIEELVKQADAAMYQAKARGRNQIYQAS